MHASVAASAMRQLLAAVLDAVSITLQGGVGIANVHVYAEARAKEPQGCQAAELIAIAVQNSQGVWLPN